MHSNEMGRPLPLRGRMVFGVTAQTAVQCEMKPPMLKIATRFLLTDLPTPRQIFATDFALRKGLRGNFTLSLMPNFLRT